MKIVTFTKPMRPYSAGDTMVVTDDQAARLVADGAARDPQSFPQGGAALASVPAVPPRRRANTYLTKAAQVLKGGSAARNDVLPL